MVPTDNLNAEVISSNSQQGVAFKPQGDMTGDDLGSRSKIINAKGLVWYPAETDVSIRPGWFYHPEENTKVKSPEKLLDIYFHSVGRNSVLLMNIPPDKDGLINEADMKILKEWKKLRTDIFKNNLAKDAVVSSANGTNVKAILDGDYSTYWTTKEKDTTAVIELNLKGTKTFNVLSLQENINIGQRIEQFEMDYWNGDAWQKAAEGTTVGYKRLIQFDPITTEKVRLKILSARLNPTIAELGLYQQSK